MNFSDKILYTAFYARERSAPDRVDDIKAITQMNGVETPLDHATAATLPALEALLLSKDPRAFAEPIFATCQEVSLDVFTGVTGLSTGKRNEHIGMSSEVAVLGLLWWGIKQDPNFGRFARTTTFEEDSSRRVGKKDGIDIVFRTDNRRHAIQVKSEYVETDVINAYRPDIKVVSPKNLLGDRQARTEDLLEAIVAEDEDILSAGVHRFVQVLRTQRAPRGRRRVI